VKGLDPLSSLATVQKILRHSDPTVTAEVYAHLDLDDMREGINRLQFGAVGSSNTNGSYVRPVASAPTGSGMSG
jgi:integrase